MFWIFIRLFFYLVFFVLFLFIFNFVIFNFVIWWSVFLLITVVFVYLNKFTSVSSTISYFVIQEFLGLIFLLLNYNLIQFLVIVLKIGIAPFHFWIFSVLSSSNGYVVLWFLTFQKLPFIPVLLYFLNSRYFLLLVLGIFFCYFQIFLSKSYKNILLISSTESFNWIIIILFFSFYSSLIFFIIYFFFLYIVLGISFKKDFDFLSWELIFVFINIPLGMVFFIKIFSLVSSFFLSSIVFLICLFLMFLSVLCFSFWILNFSTKFYFYGLNNSNPCLLFLCFPLFFLCLILEFSIN